MIQEMKSILTIWDERSFSVAANRLFITQPALSAMVKKAENRLSIRIFDRSTKPISLTPAGEKYIETAKKILRLLDEMQTDFSELNNLQTGNVKVGASLFFSTFLLPERIKEFRRLHRHIDFELIIGNPSQRRTQLRDEDIDILVAVENEMDKELMEVTAWQRELLMLAISKGNPVTTILTPYQYSIADIQNREHINRARKPLPIQLLANERFLSLKKHNDIHDRTLQICREAGFEPHFDYSTGEQMTAFHLAQVGLGVAFVREEYLHHIATTNDVYLYQVDSPHIYRNVCLGIKKSRILPPATKAFYDFLIDNEVKQTRQK